MKINSIMIIMLACLGFIAACGQSDQINASNDRSLYRSITGLQRNLPAKQRVEFQVAFWSLKQYAENESEFRNMVHRKTVPEIIELGKQNFAAQYAAANPDFTKYSSWDAMVEELTEERRKSELRPKNDPRDKGNLIHNM
ncbi:MAG: hypothetical protein ACRERV_08275 [Methylococcales bacterium]